MDIKSNTSSLDDKSGSYLRLLTESDRVASRHAQRILCVDGDEAVLARYVSAFSGRIDWSFAVTAEAGLMAMEALGPHTVVIWSLDMAEGMLRLGDIRKAAPWSVVLLLSAEPSAPASADAAIRTRAAGILPRSCPPFQLRMALEEVTASIGRWPMA